MPPPPTYSLNDRVIRLSKLPTIPALRYVINLMTPLLGLDDWQVGDAPAPDSPRATHSISMDDMDWMLRVVERFVFEEYRQCHKWKKFMEIRPRTAVNIANFGRVLQVFDDPRTANTTWKWAEGTSKRAIPALWHEPTFKARPKPIVTPYTKIYKEMIARRIVEVCLC